MRVLIIEDEKPAAERLVRVLKAYKPSIEITGILQSVKDSVEWIRNPENVADLIFMDIRLIDGLSFEIFNRVEVKTPVIFVTAYDQYALDAFKFNGIDYVLKPITKGAIENSLKKIEQLKSNLDHLFSEKKISQLKTLISDFSNKQFKTRFIVKAGDHIRTVLSNRISLFYAEGRDVFLVDNDRNKYIIDYKLEDLERSLDPTIFLRVNRTFIINIDAIRDVIKYSNSRLIVILKIEIENEIVVSRERVQQFKAWFDGLNIG